MIGLLTQHDMKRIQKPGTYLHNTLECFSGILLIGERTRRIEPMYRRCPYLVNKFLALHPKIFDSHQQFRPISILGERSIIKIGLRGKFFVLDRRWRAFGAFKGTRPGTCRMIKVGRSGICRRWVKSTFIREGDIEWYLVYEDWFKSSQAVSHMKSA